MQVVDTYMNNYRISYLSVLSKCSQSQSGKFPVWACVVPTNCGYLKIPANLCLQLLCQLCPHHTDLWFNPHFPKKITDIQFQETSLQWNTLVETHSWKLFQEKISWPFLLECLEVWLVVWRCDSYFGGVLILWRCNSLFHNNSLQ